MFCLGVLFNWKWILALPVTAVGFGSFSCPIFAVGKFTENQFFIFSVSCAHHSLAKNSWYFLASELFCTRKADIATEQLFFYKSSHSARFCQVSLGGEEKRRFFEGNRKEETNTSVSLEKGYLGGRGLPQKGSACAECRGQRRKPVLREDGCKLRHILKYWILGTGTPTSQTSLTSYIAESHGMSQTRGSSSGTENRYLADSCAQKRGMRR